jgi:4'-phosphopantetheinyl transferase
MVTDPLPIPPLAPGQCQIWWAEPTSSRLVTTLTPAERDRAAEFRHEEDRARYVVAHALARHVLAAQTGIPAPALAFSTRCDHCGAMHGKPRLDPPLGAPDFSIAHSGQRVLLAVAHATVGVDVEAIRPLGEELSLRILSAADRSAALLRYWTRKEALLKATGHGLAISPHRLTVTAPAQPAALVAWAAAPPLAAEVHLQDLNPGPDHVGCLAILGSRPEIREFDAGELLAAIARGEA